MYPIIRLIASSPPQVLIAFQAAITIPYTARQSHALFTFTTNRAHRKQYAMQTARCTQGAGKCNACETNVHT